MTIITVENGYYNYFASVPGSYNIRFLLYDVLGDLPTGIRVIYVNQP